LWVEWGNVAVVSIDGWWDTQVWDRFKDILELVLSTISDDYESLEIVLELINKGKDDEDWGPETWQAKKAIPVSRAEVIKALRELTREGYAQTYLFNAQDQRFQAIEFRVGDVDDLWFNATPQGIAAVEKFQEQRSGNS
jgi:hypothetical protein